MKQSRGWLSLQVLALFPGQQVSFVAALITASLPQTASVGRIYYIHSKHPSKTPYSFTHPYLGYGEIKASESNFK